uniref:Uncharacterized protein n=1 Tax=Anguilla anguilla TaxID=7936 RepID=A0A0E9P8V1_ANGAN
MVDLQEQAWAALLYVVLMLVQQWIHWIPGDLG